MVYLVSQNILHTEDRVVIYKETPKNSNSEFHGVSVGFIELSWIN